jgi:hypothetical protein
MSHYAINFVMFVLGVVVGKIVGRYLIRWLDVRRAAKSARPSITVEKSGEMLKALYSSEYLEGLARMGAHRSALGSVDANRSPCVSGTPVFKTKPRGKKR